MENILIKGEPYLLGNGTEKFEAEELFGLKIGDKIKTVGDEDHNITSSNRVDEFASYAIYKGTATIEINKIEKALVFELNSKEVIGPEPGEVLYKVYVVGANEIYVPRFDTKRTKNGLRIYKPVFTKVK